MGTVTEVFSFLLAHAGGLRVTAVLDGKEKRQGSSMTRRRVADSAAGLARFVTRS